MISDLRPAMLNYGLRAGLEELVDEISERSRDGVVVRLEIPASQVRYDPRVEGHLYRIVQQATENAVRHSGGLLIRIYGDLKPDSASLVVEDDGTGFPDADHLNFEHFLAHRHFGLARMFERAAIIGAELRIQSIPEPGDEGFRGLAVGSNLFSSSCIISNELTRCPTKKPSGFTVLHPW